MYKIGSGYSGTVKGRVYNHKFNEDYGYKDGWIGFVKNSLFYKRKPDYGKEEKDFEIFKVDTENLEILETFTVREPQLFIGNPYVMFSDETSLGVLTMTNNDNFVVKCFNPATNPMICVQETPLKLARKCVELNGASFFEEGCTSAQARKEKNKFPRISRQFFL